MRELAALGIVMLVAAGVGRRLLRALRLEESGLFSLGLGLGTLSLLTLALGLLGLLYPLVAYVLMAVLALAFARDIKGVLFQVLGHLRTSKGGPLGLVLGSVGCLAGLYNLVGALAPPTFFDSLVAHLGHPNWWVINHKIGFDPYNVYTNYPLNMEMLYTLGMLLLKSDILPKLFHFLAGILVTLTVFSFAKRFLNRPMALLAGFVFYLTPSVSISSTLATHDLTLALFEILSVYALFLWFEQQGSRWLLVSGICCGLAMGTKYTGLYFLPTLMVLIILRLSLEKGRPWYVLRKSGEFVLSALLVFSPWLAKNLAFTGNPVYPALSTIFGVKEFQKVALGLTTAKGVSNPIDFLRLPWEMTVHHFKFGSVSQIGPLFLFFLPPLLLLRGVERSVRYVLALSGILFVSWGVTIPNTRYFLPGIGLLSIAVGYAVFRLCSLSRVLRALVAAVLAGSILFNLGYTVSLLNRLFEPLPVVFRLESKDDYLSRHLRPYPAIKFANQNLPLDARILFVGETRTYYCERNHLASSAYDKTPIVEWVRASKGVEELLEKLRSEGITHLLYNAVEARFLNQKFGYFKWKPDEKELFDQFTSGYLKVLYEEGSVYLLEIKYPA